MDIKQEHNEIEDEYKHLVKTGAYYPFSIEAEPIYTIDRSTNLLTEDIKTQRREYAPRAGGYNCTMCEDTFKWKKSLEQHMKKHAADNKQVETTAKNCAVTIKQEMDDFEAEAELLTKPNLSAQIKIEPADLFADTCETQTREETDNTEVEVEIKQETEEVVVGSVRLETTHLAAPLDDEGTILNTRPLEEIPKNIPKRYTCHMCGVVFKLESVLLRHMKMHRDKTLRHLRSNQKFHATTNIELDECTALEMRRPKRTAEKPVVCSLYGYKVTGKPEWSDPTATNMRAKPFECDYCDYKTISQGMYSRHLRRHKVDRPYECSMCSYETTFRNLFQNHMKVHTDETYNCTRCDFKTRHRSSLMVHLRRHGSRSYKCSACDYRAVTKHILWCHEKRHTGEKPHGCSLCGYVTFSKSCLTVHMRRHLTEKTSECSMRSFRTAYRAVSERHKLKLETGEEPYGCSVCEFTTYAQSLLASHLLIHGAVKPYECFLCDFQTANKKALTAHEEKHGRRELHECSVCRYKTHRKGYLTIHMRKHKEEML